MAYNLTYEGSRMKHILELPLAPRPMTLDFTATMPDDPSLDANSFKLTLEARKIHRWHIVWHSVERGETFEYKPTPTLCFMELDEKGREWCFDDFVNFNYEKHFNEIGILVGEAWSKALNPWLSLNDALEKGMDVKSISDWLVCYKDWEPRYICSFQSATPRYIDKAKAGEAVGFMPVPWASPDVLEACKRIEVYKGK